MIVVYYKAILENWRSKSPWITPLTPVFTNTTSQPPKFEIQSQTPLGLEFPFEVSRSRVDPSSILRRVIINLDAIHEFVRTLEPHLKDNVEMMGILLARAERVGDVTVFIQNTILIPEQSGTSDSCTMIGEEDLLIFTYSNNL